MLARLISRGNSEIVAPWIVVSGSMGSCPRVGLFTAMAEGGWLSSFNAHRAPATMGRDSYDPDTMNQDIAIAAADDQKTAGPVIWLTDTPDIDEADSSIARFATRDGPAEQFVVGWSEPSAQARPHKLARIDAAGEFLEGPIALPATIAWGRRDDPFRRHTNGDVVWAWFSEAGSNTLQFVRLRAD